MGFFGKFLKKALQVVCAPVTFGVALSATAFMATGLAFFEALDAVEAKVYRRSTSMNVYHNPAIEACVKGLRHGLKSVWTDFGIVGPLAVTEALFSAETREPMYKAIEGNLESLDIIKNNSKLLNAAGKNKEAMYEALTQPDSLESRTKIAALLEDSLKEAKSPQDKNKISALLEEAHKKKAEFESGEVVNQTIKENVTETAQSVSNAAVSTKENIPDVVEKTPEKVVSDLEKSTPERSNILNTDVPSPNGVETKSHSQLMPAEIENVKGSGTAAGA